jgi:hypothetical protein
MFSIYQLDQALAINGANAAIAPKVQAIVDATAVDIDGSDYQIKKAQKIQLLVKRPGYPATTEVTLTRYFPHGL